MLKDCTFYPLYIDDINPNNGYTHSYRVNITQYNAYYIIMKYYVNSPYNSILVKGLYKLSNSSSKSLSTLGIVFIVIGGITFIVIIITIIFFCCKKKPTNNTIVVSDQPALVVQTHTTPSSVKKSISYLLIYDIKFEFLSNIMVNYKYKIDLYKVIPIFINK